MPRPTRLDSAYWWSNIRQLVRFAAAMETVKRDHRPDVVLELAPHSALQPIVAQCVEDAASPPVSIPTLMRDTDTCLGFHEALGNLFKAGVSLDFAAQYPRPDPIVHLLPGHPRDEQKTVDNLLDDEFFLQQGDYAHGPLVGHRIASDHLLFEARLSEAAFPWLAEHRVHHASIMPAAGFIELVLQALEGAPVRIEMLEFLQPCPIPRDPVRLQTALQPVANSPDEYTLTISTQPYEIDAKCELHGRGQVRCIGPDRMPDVPGHVSEIDASRYEPLAYADGRRTLRALRDGPRRDLPVRPPLPKHAAAAGAMSPPTTCCSRSRWTKRSGEGAKRKGYVVFPALLDGGLQSYLYDLMLGRRSLCHSAPGRERDLPAPAHGAAG